MVMSANIKRAICSLFEVHADENGVQRVVTPLEYAGSNDKVVVRVRPSGNGYVIDENGEAAFFASMSGGDVEAEAVERWAEELSPRSPLKFDDDERIHVYAEREELVAPYIFRVAEAAQQLHAIATARADRQASDFKERVKTLVQEVAAQLNWKWAGDVELPIAGALKADHVLGDSNPLIIIAATSAARLLEAEVIFMQYRAEKKPGYVWAIAEDQISVGRKQYERAAYYTDKAVIYNQDALKHLIASEYSGRAH